MPGLTDFMTPSRRRARHAGLRQVARGQAARGGAPVAPRLLALGLVAGLLAGCQPDAAEDVVVAPPPRTVWVEPVVAASEQTLEFSGTVRARSDAPVAFRVGGKLAERTVDVGDLVTRGDVLGRLDADDLQVAMRAETARARAAAAEAERSADELIRLQALKEKGHVSQAALDRAVAGADAAAENLKAARERERLAENQLAYATLTAEVDGVVTATLAEPGEVIAAGQPIVRMARNGEREAEVAIPETYVKAIGTARAEITLWVAPDRPLAARLRELSPQADPAARTFTARFAMEDPDDLARLGMTAVVALTLNGAEGEMAVPLSAVWYKGEAAHVWRGKEGASHVEAVPVTVSRLSGEQAFVTGALHPGDLVVSMGVHRLDPDLEVRLERRPASARVQVGALQ
ncbi:efflux RND transporter periplasmic adaptor subunit [Stappia indica]|uniref:efflux RND transporter periplasmic adaptor subunit n=1 Tax=Stappia indica TaxID=538381 RepID=UPI001CD48524|nr:efflux RND transporter periplasmic adaptor subunit [Stappia indica]MCA1298883.1 efflux RND transporter periplasmic adaptor subunit [Stappia indica]